MKELTRIIALITLTVIIIPCSMSACSTDSSPIKETAPHPSDNIQNIELDSYEEQIAYYMALSESLNQELLILKEEKYVESSEKDLKIAELEKKVKALQNTILSMSTPEGGEHGPSLDQIVSKQNYEYDVSEDGIILTKYTGNETEVIVPAEINGFPVREIGDGAFKGSHVSSVTLPSSLRKIGWFAFESCARLESVYIPPSVTSIGYGAFNACSASIKIICESGSYAASFAQSWGIATSLK